MFEQVLEGEEAVAGQVGAAGVDHEEIGERGDFPAVASLEGHTADDEIIRCRVRVCDGYQAFPGVRVYLVEHVFEGLEACPLHGEAQTLASGDEVVHVEAWRPLMGFEGCVSAATAVNQQCFPVLVAELQVCREAVGGTPGDAGITLDTGRSEFVLGQLEADIPGEFLCNVSLVAAVEAESVGNHKVASTSTEAVVDATREVTHTPVDGVEVFKLVVTVKECTHAYWLTRGVPLVGDEHTGGTLA